MTHPYTKLAEDLDVVRQSFREMSHADRNPNWFTDGPRAATAHRLMWQRKGLEVADSIDEAARILRAAAAVDVAGLMAMVDEHGSTRWGTGFNEGAKQSGDAAMNDRKALQQRAALESALRMALAGREGFVLVPVEPTPEMVDAARSLTSWPDGVYRAMLAAAPKGTP